MMNNRTDLDLDFGRVIRIYVLLIFAITAQVLGSAPNERVEKPKVFEGALINCVVLPFETSGNLRKSADELSLLIHLDTFYSLLKFDNVGAVRLTDPEKHGTDPDLIYAQLLGEAQGALGTVRTGNALVMIWGRIYEEESQILLQTYLRFVRKGTLEEITMRVGDHVFSGSLPTQAISFPPRRLSRDDLAKIRTEFELIARVHTKPEESSPSQPMPLNPSNSYSWHATGVHENWIEMRGHGPGPSGWVRVRADIGNWSPRKQMPELSYVDGLFGYLYYRVADAQNKGRLTDLASKSARKAFQAFTTNSAIGSDESVASAHLICGFLEILSQPSPEGARGALKDFEIASKLIPYSAAVKNLRMITRLVLAYADSKPGFRPREFADQFLKVSSLEPERTEVLENIKVYYNLLDKMGPPPGTEESARFSKVDLATRSAFVDGVKPKKIQAIGDGVRIVSLLPHPGGNEVTNERVTLENKGTQTINLAGWQIVDGKGGIWALDADGALDPGQSREILRNGRTLELTNNGATLFLLNPRGATVQQVRYGTVRINELVTVPPP